MREKPLVRLRSKIQFHLIIASAYAGKLSLLSYLPPPYPRSLGGLTHELGANRSLRLTSSVVDTTPALDNDLVHLSSLIKKKNCIVFPIIILLFLTLFCYRQACERFVLCSPARILSPSRVNRHVRYLVDGYRRTRGSVNLIVPAFSDTRNGRLSRAYSIDYRSNCQWYLKAQ